MTTQPVLAVARRAVMIAFAALAFAVAALAVALLAFSRTDTSSSDGSGSGVVESDRAEADTAEPDAPQSDVVESDVSESDTSASDAFGSSAVESDTAESDAAEGDTAESDTAGGSDEPAASEPAEDPAPDDPPTSTDDSTDPGTEVPVESESADSTEEASAPETTPEDTDETTDEPDPGASAVSVDLPGEPYEFGPAAGTGLAVVGVSYNGTLNVRDVPNGEIIARLGNVMDGVRDPAVHVRGANSDEIIATLDLTEGVVATGNTRKLPTTVWYEFQFGDMVGWASSAYLAPLGLTDDATAAIVATLGETPVADTLLELGLRVANVMASDEPPSSVVVSGAPTVFEALGEMTVDVVNIGDDSVLGFRLRIFAHPAEDWTQDDPGPFTLKSVESTLMCHNYRGVSEEGVCN